MTRWKTDQEHELINLVQQGMGIEELAKYFKRSQEAIRLKTRRCGLAIPETQKEVSSTRTPQHGLEPLKPAANLISLEDTMKLLLGAFDQLRSPDQLSTLQVKRLRLLTSIGKTYMTMLERYEKWTDFEQRMINMDATFLDLYKRDLEKETDPKRRAVLERQIALSEENLEKSGKLYGYKPFQKKPSLMPEGRAY